MSIVRLVLSAMACTMLAACNLADRESIGFSLPEGDAEQGLVVFKELSCSDCHTLVGKEFTGEEWEYPQTRAINIELGGKVTRIRTYGDLVSSVINPSHRITRGYSPDEILTDGGESKMRRYNDVMTVTQLVDLVTFLKTQYSLAQIPPGRYPRFNH
ncbi:MAG: cytochrome C [Pseudomonadota bacterium]